MNEYDWEAKHYADEQREQKKLEREERIRKAKRDQAKLAYGIAPGSCIPDRLPGHLILVRNVSERIVIFAGADRIVIQVDKANCGQATLSFVAPKSVRIVREEILDEPSGRDSSGDCQADRGESKQPEHGQFP